MKKMLSGILSAVFVAGLLSGAAVPAQATTTASVVKTATSVVKNTTNYDTENTTVGAIGVRYLAGGDTRTKTRVQKDAVNYDYDLFGRDAFEYFPMQLGNGDYSVSVFQNVVDNRYRVVERKTVNTVVENFLDVFRNSIQTVRWSEDMAVVKKAEELTEGLKTDRQKIDAIYQFVVKNFKYDYDKISGLTSSYVPDPDLILEAGKGICYDYSAVFGAMLRSQGVPVKLIKGYTDNVKEYHAWNEVWLADEKRWIVVDTTYDSVMVGAGRKVAMEKKATLYRASKEY
jgi:transglutaminase-like putative cysteine protease